MKKKRKSKPPAKPSEKPAHDPGGRPTLYREEYCEMLIQHMKQGDSFATFGAILNPPVSVQTVYDWAERHPRFLEAKTIGEPLAEKFWTGVLKSGATGQLRRVKSEKVQLDQDGKPVIGADGKPVYDREYEAATFNATATIFALKNKFPTRWRDRKEVEVAGKDGGPGRVSTMTPAQAKVAVKKLAAILAEVEEDEPEE